MTAASPDPWDDLTGEPNPHDPDYANAHRLDYQADAIPRWCRLGVGHWDRAGGCWGIHYGEVAADPGWCDTCEYRGDDPVLWPCGQTVG